MKNNTLRSILCLVLLAAVLLAGAWGVNKWTAPIIEANAKALLGDAVVLFDAADPAASELKVSSPIVRSILKDESKQLYTLKLTSEKGYEGPIELTMNVGFDGRIADLAIDSTSETRELPAEFLPSFSGKDSALEGVELGPKAQRATRVYWGGKRYDRSNNLR